MTGTRTGRIVGLALGALLGLAGAWFAGLVWFVDGLDARPAPPDVSTDAIVVLTGGSQRIESGLALLVAGKARKLFVSGVHPGVDRRAMFRGDAAELPWIDCCVILGHSADNTEGNAIETAAWLKHEDYHSLRLVTANYHMKRALLEFRRFLPPDVLIVPDAVSPEGAKHGVLLGWRGSARVILVEYMKYLGAVARAILIPHPAMATAESGA